ncbi:MAG: phosphoserine phosphatase SerB [Methylotenera sp.]|nr:phosphoserine phosphatase SerB [Methylotenera sp.]
MRLVVQSSAISISHLAHIHQLCNTSVQFVQIAQYAYYLANQSPLPSVQQFCTDQHIDCAYVDDKQHIKNFGLCVMDMDSTLINIECIDEIADMMNLKPQVSAITESAMRGEIDFATSLKQRVALLKGLDESALQRVIDERLKLNPGALEWIAACKVNHIKTMVVSGGFTLFANHVQKLLGLDYAIANTFEVINGKLTGQILGDIVDADRKAQELVKLRDDLGLTPDQTIAIGDGAHDLKLLSAAAVGVAYHAKPIVQQQASYALNFVGLDGIANLLTT